MKHNFPDPSTYLAFVATIQFTSSLQLAKEQLATYYTTLEIPQCKPLSPGEILGTLVLLQMKVVSHTKGCTSPKMQGKNYDALVYMGTLVIAVVIV